MRDAKEVVTEKPRVTRKKQNSSSGKGVSIKTRGVNQTGSRTLRER